MAASRSLLCLIVSLMRASAWSMMAGVPVPHGRAHCFRRQPEVAVSRRAVALQMSSDGLSAEFQVRARAAGPRTRRVGRHSSPAPCSQPRSVASQRLVSQRSGTVFGKPTEVLREQKVDTPWVLIFNAGTNDEGMCARDRATPSPRAGHTPTHAPRCVLAPRRYTLQGRKTSAECSGTFVLAFERREEASRFSMLLQAQGFGMPTAAAWDAEELSDFCASADFGIGFVPTDALLFPPQNNYFDADTDEEEALPMKPGTRPFDAPPPDEWKTTLASDRGGQSMSPNYVSNMGSDGPDNFMSPRPLGPPARPGIGAPLGQPPRPGMGAPLGPPPHSGMGAGPSPYETTNSPPRPSRPSSSRGQHAPDERDGTRGRSSFGEHRPPRYESAPGGHGAPRPPAHKDPDFMKTPPRASPGGGSNQGGGGGESKGISSRPQQPPRSERDRRDGESLSSRPRSPPREDSRDASRPVPRTVYGDADDVLREEKVEAPWVLIFNKGREDEGMYTLQGRETPEKGSGTFVMAFERQEEASRFSMLLQVTPTLALALRLAQTRTRALALTLIQSLPRASRCSCRRRAPASGPNPNPNTLTPTLTLTPAGAGLRHAHSDGVGV